MTAKLSNTNRHLNNLLDEIDEFLSKLKDELDDFLKKQIGVDFFSIDMFKDYGRQGLQVSLYYFYRDETWDRCEVFIYYEDNRLIYDVFNLKAVPHYRNIVYKIIKLAKSFFNDYYKQKEVKR